AGGDVPCEYGAPHADYKISGVVTDEAGNPVKGIKTTFLNQNYAVKSDSSDASGKYELNVRSYPMLTGDKLAVEDVDGAENGEFQTDTLDLSKAEPVRVKKGSGWYEGAFEVSQNVVLKSKK
ncbi:MAG: radical SAM-associated putative lipoprotein, partial [Paludibacteraceae bacterium]|nr:radical SAM-associated putative lipoprotein [Paludibacteraceae bacterium]